MAFADPVHAHGSDGCPECGAPLVLRLAGATGRPRRRFWGCSTYPVTGCRGSLAFDQSNVEAGYDWPRPVRRHGDPIPERSMTNVAMAAVVGHEEPSFGRRITDQPTHVSEAPSRRAAKRRAQAATVRRAYQRRVDERVARAGDRWPLLLMAYIGFAGGAVLATAWIHPAVAGVALMAMTALFVEALLRPAPGPAPAAGDSTDPSS